MNEQGLRDFYKTRGTALPKIDKAVSYVIDFEDKLTSNGSSLEQVSVNTIKEYILELINTKQNTSDRLLALAMYFYISNRQAAYIYFTSIMGGRTVLPSIAERLAQISGKEKAKQIFTGIEAPPLGSPIEAYPEVTSELMKRLKKELPENVYKKVLAGNHHKIPVQIFSKLKEKYEQADSIDQFLDEIHEASIKELEEHYKDNKIWYEQKITAETITHVKNNPEVLGGVRKGNKIYITKFPYLPAEYLAEKDPLKKRYYLCHCPLARASIIGETKISSQWCYCSGGYTKLKFDVIFEQETEVEVLENALAGNTQCRFAITIPEGKEK